MERDHLNDSNHNHVHNFHLTVSCILYVCVSNLYQYSVLSARRISKLEQSSPISIRRELTAHRGIIIRMNLCDARLSWRKTSKPISVWRIETPPRWMWLLLFSVVGFPFIFLNAQTHFSVLTLFWILNQFHSDKDTETTSSLSSGTYLRLKWFLRNLKRVKDNASNIKQKQ